MRIIAGKFKGRIIDIPANLGVRPTTDRAREALFNILTNRLDWETARVLDGFTGSGAVGIEALSRGAEACIFVDKNPKTVGFLKKKMAELEINNATATQADVLAFLQRTTEKFNLVFLDPPYALPNKSEIVNLIFNRNLLAEDGLLVMEHASYENLSQNPHFEEKRVYGNSTFSFFS